MTARLRHSGHTQSPPRTAFPIIILHQTSVGRHHYASALAIGMVKLQYGFLCLGYFVTGRYGTTIQDTANLTELAYSRLKVNNPQQAAADGLSELGIQATLVVHFPSRINAPEGILLTYIRSVAYSDCQKRNYRVCIPVIWGSSECYACTLC